MGVALAVLRVSLNEFTTLLGARKVQRPHAFRAPKVGAAPKQD
jgi:hypothetical protein